MQRERIDASEDIVTVARAVAPVNQPRQARDGDSHAEVRTDHIPEIGGRAPDSDDTERIKLMRAFMRKANLSTEFPRAISEWNWQGLSGLFDAQVKQREEHAGERRRLHVGIAKSKLEAGLYSIEDREPQNLREDCSYSFTPVRDELTKRTKYKVVIVWPGESPRGDWLHQVVQRLDNDIALLVRSYLDRL